MKTKEILFYIFISIFFTSCATIKKPLWVKEFGTRTFSKDGIEGIGFASFNKKDKSSLRAAREAAYNEAMKNLAIKLKTELKGTIEHKMQDKITKINKKYHAEATDEIESLVNVMFETVLGRKYFEEYIDYKNSLYWVYVWTTKADLQKSIAEELEKQEIKNSSIMRSCVKHYNEALRLTSLGDILSGITLLNQILTNLKEIKGIYVLDDIDNISLFYEAKNKMLKIISGVTLSAVSDKSIETLLNVPVEVELKVICKFSDENNKEMLLTNFPLKARFVKGGGEMEHAKITNDKGIAAFKIYKLTAKENEIEVSPDTDLIKERKVVFYVIARSLREVKKVSVYVQGEDLVMSNFLKNEVVAKMRSNEFNIVDDENPDYVLTIKYYLHCLGNETSLLDSKKIPFVEIYSGSATVEIIDVHTKQVLLSKTFSGMTGFGKTTKMAKENSIKKLAEVIADFVVNNFQ